jgi:gluconate kinase
MQPGLLDSQLQTLEKPTAEETDVISLDIDQPVDQIVRQALSALKVTTVNAAS